MRAKETRVKLSARFRCGACSSVKKISDARRDGRAGSRESVRLLYKVLIHFLQETEKEGEDHTTLNESGSLAWKYDWSTHFDAASLEQLGGALLIQKEHQTRPRKNGRCRVYVEKDAKS